MRSSLLAFAAILASTSVGHADVELKNDGFVSGGNANFQTGFVADEAGAVRFVAPAADRQLLRLDLLFGGSGTTEQMTLKIFDDTAGTDTPGALLFMGDFEMTGSDTAMHALDISSQNVIVPQQFRVAIEFHHDGVPTIASDADATIAADLNYIFAAGVGWKKSSALGLAGDWIIRATVTDANSGPTQTFCDIDEECLLGNFCDVDHHACIHDCQTNSDCTGGGTCSGRGQCSGGTPPTDDGCQTTTAPHGAALGLATFGMLVIFRRRRPISRR
jgi:MYXO-CTERM domain-containing protein